MIGTQLIDEQGNRYLFYTFHIFCDEVILFFVDNKGEVWEVTYSFKFNKYVDNYFAEYNNLFSPIFNSIVDRCVQDTVEKVKELKKDCLTYKNACEKVKGGK